MINKDLTIFVSTCDSYSDLWIPFSKCLEKYVDLGCEVIFVSESKKIDGYHTVTPGFLSWGERNLIALNEVKTKYVFWLFEDYFFFKNISQVVMGEFLKFAKEKDIDRLQISPNWQNKNIYSFLETKNFNPKFEFTLIPSSNNYSVSMQPSIWNKGYIKSLLKNDYSPWDFEIKGSIMNTSKKVYIDSSITDYPYFNAVRKKNVISILRFIKKLDRLIEKIFYSKKPYKYSRGLKKLLEQENLDL